MTRPERRLERHRLSKVWPGQSGPHLLYGVSRIKAQYAKRQIMPMNQRLVVIGVTLAIAVLTMLGVAAAAPGGSSSTNYSVGLGYWHGVEQQFRVYLPIVLK